MFNKPNEESSRYACLADQAIASWKKVLRKAR
jgi:hypothetical protein